MRYEARIRLDQYERLDRLRRRLAAARADKSERFTHNTLIRVAIDLLLAHADELHGDTEVELWESLQSTFPENRETGSR